MDSSATTSLLVKIAAVSVTAVSLAGVGVLTGVLPTPGGQAPAVSTPVPVAAPAASTAASASTQVAPPTAPQPPLPPLPSAATPAAAAASAAPTPRPVAQAPVHRETAAHKTHAQETAKSSHSNRRDANTPPPPATEPGRIAQIPDSAAAAKPAPCGECGVVDNIEAVTKPGQGSGLGAVAGGVLGGILGHQVGNGSGRDLATLAGAVGGAFAGNQVERNHRSTQEYRVTVRFQDGSSRSFSQSSQPGWRIGDRVKVVDGSLQPY